MNENRKTDLAFKVLDNIQNLIKFADTKVNILLIISGVTTSFVLTNFQILYNLCLISKIFLGLFFLAFLVFIILALITISPRADRYTRESTSRTIYFGHIAKRKQVETFIEEYTKLDEKTFQEDLLYQIFENAKIADKKFKFYKWSLLAIKFQMGLFLIILLIKLII